MGIGNSFKLYKFAYWPSNKAKRINITYMGTTGTLIPESDTVGDGRKYTNKDNIDEDKNDKN